MITDDISGRLPVHLAAMADLHDLYDSPLVVYRVHDPVGTLADAVAVLFSGELLTPMRARCVSETLDSGDEANADCARLNGLEFLGSRRLDEDAIACHAGGAP